MNQSTTTTEQAEELSAHISRLEVSFTTLNVENSENFRMRML